MRGVELADCVDRDQVVVDDGTVLREDARREQLPEETDLLVGRGVSGGIDGPQQQLQLPWVAQGLINQFLGGAGAGRGRLVQHVLGADILHIDDLAQLVDSHDHEMVFCGAPVAPGYAAPPWPAASGAPPSTAPPAPGPFSQACIFTTPGTPTKTWLIEDDIPEIAQARRLGHRLPGIRGVYSHVTPFMIARITTSLQARWQASHAPTPLPQRHLHAA
jgi:hypothetical protein